jgi:hypothetical protein
MPHKKAEYLESGRTSIARQRVVKTHFRDSAYLTDITTEMKARARAVFAVTNTLANT